MERADGTIRVYFIATMVHACVMYGANSHLYQNNGTMLFMRLCARNVDEIKCMAEDLPTITKGIFGRVYVTQQGMLSS
jgi:hypothetical protein